jgi:hypothetical protein
VCCASARARPPPGARRVRGQAAPHHDHRATCVVA